MDAAVPDLEISYTRTSGTQARIKAQLGDDVLALDCTDVAKASARARFVKQLCDGRDGIDQGDVEAELLRIGTELAKAPADKPDAPEVDGMIIVRPELFNTPELSGITVAARRIVGGKLAGQWETYLRWPDGKREKRRLASSIELADGRSLWLDPIPGDPGPTIESGWTAKARRAWLDGAASPDPVDVFGRLCERIAYFVDLPSDSGRGAGAMIALWIMFSYVYPAWSAVPYLSLGGPAGSGKTTLLDILSRLIFRPLRSSSMTGPCLFRTLHENGGTLLFDEAERLNDHSPEAGETRSILLSGYKRGSPAVRLEKVGDSFKRTTFDVFGPKALAAIAQLPSALASRCIRLTMFRASKHSEKPRRRIDAEPELWANLRGDLHALALEHGATWRELAGRHDVCGAMSGRSYELWQPLLAIAAWIEEQGAKDLLGIVQDFAAETIELACDDATPPADEILLRMLAAAVMDGEATQLTPGKLLERAKQEDAELFRRWKAQGVSATLGRYRIRSNKAGGKRTFGRVQVGDLRRVESSYGLDLGLSQAPQGAPAPQELAPLC